MKRKYLRHYIRNEGRDIKGSKVSTSALTGKMMTLIDCDVMYINVITRVTTKKIIKRNAF